MVLGGLLLLGRGCLHNRILHGVLWLLPLLGIDESKQRRIIYEHGPWPTSSSWQGVPPQPHPPRGALAPKDNLRTWSLADFFFLEGGASTTASSTGCFGSFHCWGLMKASNREDLNTSSLADLFFLEGAGSTTASSRGSFGSLRGLLEIKRQRNGLPKKSLTGFSAIRGRSIS